MDTLTWGQNQQLISLYACTDWGLSGFYLHGFHEIGSPIDYWTLDLLVTGGD